MPKYRRLYLSLALLVSISVMAACQQSLRPEQMIPRDLNLGGNQPHSISVRVKRTGDFYDAWLFGNLINDYFEPQRFQEALIQAITRSAAFTAVDQGARYSLLVDIQEASWEESHARLTTAWTLTDKGTTVAVYFDRLEMKTFEIAETTEMGNSMKVSFERLTRMSIREGLARLMKVQLADK